MVVARRAGPGGLVLVLTFFIHVFDGGFVDHEVRLAIFAVHLEAGLVVPLDVTVDFLTVSQHDNHGSARLHLLLVIKIFRVGLFGWRNFASSWAAGRAFGAISTFTAIATFGAVMPLGTVASILHLCGDRAVIAVVLGARQSRPDELSIREVFFVDLGGRHGINNFLHKWRYLGYTHSCKPHTRGDPMNVN